MPKTNEMMNQDKPISLEVQREIVQDILAHAREARLNKESEELTKKLMLMGSFTTLFKLGMAPPWWMICFMSGTYERILNLDNYSAKTDVVEEDQFFDVTPDCYIPPPYSAFCIDCGDKFTNETPCCCSAEVNPKNLYEHIDGRCVPCCTKYHNTHEHTIKGKE